MLERYSDFKTGDVGFLRALPAAVGASWTGGTFIGESKPVNVNGTDYPLYPDGRVINIEGDDILLKDITIEGYRGIAMMIAGDNVRVINPTIRNPQLEIPDAISTNPPQYEANGAGIRVKHGERFRCYGGHITSGGDAAIQFSGDSDYSGDITDGLFQDVTCRAEGGGRLMLVGTTSPNIRNVGFVGITGEVIGKGDCIRIQNRNPDSIDFPPPFPKKVISHVFFRDIVVVNGNPTSYAVAIENELTTSALTGPAAGDDIAVSDILFVNVSVTTTAASDIAFATFAAGATTLRPIRDVSWRGGGLTAYPGSTAAAISLSQLDGGVFEALRIDAGGARDALICGDTILSDSPASCAHVVFRDVAVRGVGATPTMGNQQGFRPVNAVACGFVGGSIAPSSGATAVGARFAATASRCYVTGTNLAAFADGSGVGLGLSSTPLVRDLFGQTLVVLRPRSTGAPADVNISMMWINGRAGYYRLSPGGSGLLSTIQLGSPGDLLILRHETISPPTPAITVTDAGGLALHGNRTLTDEYDTLTLVNTGSGLWSELAYSDNA